MKVLAIALLAICLIQGHNAQPQLSGLRNLVTGAASNMQNAASGALSAAQGAAKSAVTNAQNAVSAAEESISELAGSAQSVISSAADNVSAGVNQIAASIKDLDIDEMMDTINGAEQVIKNTASTAQTTLSTAIDKLEKSAMSGLNSTTSGWNSGVRAAVMKAAEAGVDVSGCAVNGVTELGTNATVDATKCVTNQITKGIKLAKNIAMVPKRATDLSTQGAMGYAACRSETGYKKTLCKGVKLAPVAVKSVLLVKDTVSYAREAVTMVTTLKEQVGMCVARVATVNTVKAATLAKSIISCVSEKTNAIAESQ